MGGKVLTVTLNTPEQTAREAIGADALAGIGYGADLRIATRAIAADRKHLAAHLAPVLDAARAWRDELEEFIIPESERVKDDESADAQRAQAATLTAALEALGSLA